MLILIAINYYLNMSFDTKFRLVFLSQNRMYAYK